jgi:hypothetical protein
MEFWSNNFFKKCKCNNKKIILQDDFYIIFCNKKLAKDIYNNKIKFIDEIANTDYIYILQNNTTMIKKLIFNNLFFNIRNYFSNISSNADIYEINEINKLSYLDNIDLSYNNIDKLRFDELNETFLIKKIFEPNILKIGIPMFNFNILLNYYSNYELSEKQKILIDQIRIRTEYLNRIFPHIDTAIIVYSKLNNIEKNIYRFSL